MLLIVLTPLYPESLVLPIVSEDLTSRMMALLVRVLNGDLHGVLNVVVEF